MNIVTIVENLKSLSNGELQTLIEHSCAELNTRTAVLETVDVWAINLEPEGDVEYYESYNDALEAFARIGKYIQAKGMQKEIFLVSTTLAKSVADKYLSGNKYGDPNI